MENEISLDIDEQDYSSESDELSPTLPNKKDWFAPAAASLSRLNQIQASVYNLGFQDAKTLKPSKSIASRQNSSRLENNKDDGLDVSTVSSYSISQQNVWGSNASIPDMIARADKSKINLRSRPSSAKCVGRPRTGGKMRPLSAKEPLYELNRETDGKSKEKQLGVLGSKKSVTAKSEVSIPKGLPPRPQKKPTEHAASAWCEETEYNKVLKQLDLSALTIMSPGRELLVPLSSPAENDQSETKRKAQTLLRRPRPEIIKLSLPTVETSNEDNDELDTERLLSQADKMKSDSCRAEKTKKTLQSDINFDKNNLREDISYSASIHTDSVSFGDQNVLDRDSFSEGGLAGNMSNQETSNESSNVSIHNKFETKPNIRPMKKDPFLLVKKNSNIKNEETKNESRLEKKRPVVKMGVRIEEDKNIVVNITPRANVSDSHSCLFQDQDSKCDKNNAIKENEIYKDFDKSNLNSNGLSEKRNIEESRSNKNLAPTVTVQYEESVEGGDKNNIKGNHRRPKEIESWMSKFNSGGESFNNERPVSASLHKSSKERNYYELQRKNNLSVLDSDSSNRVYKTTKTIELSKDSVTESLSKEIIPTQTIKPKEDNRNRLHKPLPKTENLTTIQKPISQSSKKAGNVTSAKSAGSSEDRGQKLSLEEIEHMKSLEILLSEAKSMAENSLKDLPPTGKKTEKTRLLNSKPHKTTVLNQHLCDKKQGPNNTSSSTKQCFHSHEKDETFKTSKPIVGRYRRIKSAEPQRDAVVITSVKKNEDFLPPQFEESRLMKSKMAALGVDVDTNVLHRALNAPACQSLYYEIPANLPQNNFDRLLPHYKYWLAEDYKRVKQMERNLAKDDEIRYMNKLEEERKSKRQPKKKRGKKKKKIIRRNSVI